MDELVGQQVRSGIQLIFIGESIFAGCIQAGLMMFNAVMEGLVAKGNEEMISVRNGPQKKEQRPPLPDVGIG